MQSPLREGNVSVHVYGALPVALADRSKNQASAAAVGLNGLTVRLLCMQVTLAFGTGLLFRYTGLSLQWASLVPAFVVDTMLLVFWAYFYTMPGRPREWAIPECAAVLFLVLTSSQVLGPAQYAAAALNRPLVDATLARADAALGIHVPALAFWTKAHPVIDAALSFAYFTLLPQFLLVIPVTGLVMRDRDALWEYAFHFHVCAIITVTSLALWPAACAFQYFGFESTLDQTRFIAHFNAVRAGSLTTLRIEQLEGLISVPSFHVAGALMITWVLRRHLWVLIPVAMLNTALIAATFMSGAHYAVDTLITVPVFAASVLLYRKWAAPLHRISDRPAECAEYAVEMR
jgi:hypothetical protein